MVLCHVALALAMLDLSAMDLFNMTGKKGAKENLDLLSLPGLLEKSPADHSQPTNGTDKKGGKDSLSLFDHSAKNSTKSATWKDSLNLFDHSAKNGTGDKLSKWKDSLNLFDHSAKNGTGDKLSKWKESLNLFDHSAKNGTKSAKSFLPSFATDLLSHVTGKGKQQSAKVRTRLVYMPKTVYVPVYITENPLEAGSAAAQAPIAAGSYFYPGYPGFPGYGFVQGGEYLQTIAAMGPQYSVAPPPQVKISRRLGWFLIACSATGMALVTAFPWQSAWTVSDRLVDFWDAWDEVARDGF